MAQRPPYPLTAIVGQERMKQALVLNAISSSIGGVLVWGERGTAESTAAHALAALLPEIEVVADCPFFCDPRGPEALCDNRRARLAHGEPLPVARRRKAERARRKLTFIVESQDLPRKVRVRRVANLVLFVVDASWSTATEQRLEATKGAVLSLLRDAYRRRDQVGLIVFRAATADLVLPPTSSVELAQRALQHIPVGGKTPLSAALLLTHEVCIAARRRNPEVLPLIIISTDGAGNMSLTGLPAQEEGWQMTNLVRESHLRAIVLNMVDPTHDIGLPHKLANALGGPCYTLPELSAATLAQTVREKAPIWGR